MAGPSIAVRVIGDLKGLSQAVDAAVGKAGTAAGKLHTAFSGALNALNQTGVLGPFSQALNGVDTAMTQLGEHGKGLGIAMAGVGATMAGVGVGLSAIGSKEKAAHDQLQTAVEATGKSYDDYAKKIEAAEKHNEKFGDTSATTADALRVLTQATSDPAKALQLLGTATDLAAAKHEDLTTAATQLGKVYNGNTKLLKEFGITVTKTATVQKAVETATKQASAADTAYANAKKRLADLETIDATKKHLTAAEAIALKNAQDAVTTAAGKSMEAHARLNAAQDAAKKSTVGTASAVDQLAKKLHGQADAAANTFSGHLKALGATVEDAAASFGQKFGPALTIGGTVLATLGSIMTGVKATTDLFSKTTGEATAAVDAMTASEDAAAVSEGLALAPVLLIVAALAALVVAGYVVYRNWQTIWNGIQVVISAVWGWIHDHWPLIFAILLGPVGLAAVQIIKHFDDIWNAIKQVWQWIKDIWGFIYQWLIQPYITASLIIIGVMNDIWNAIRQVYNWISSAWSAISGWLTAPFSTAASAIRTAWDGLYSFFQGLPGRMGGIFTHMWDGLAGAFRGALNAVIDLWNSLHFTVPKVSIGPIHFGGQTIGVPTIPHLAQGGLMTSDGLVFAHAGEVISPAPGTSRTTPAVWIEHATFKETLDVDEFLRHAAWAIQRERI